MKKTTTKPLANRVYRYKNPCLVFYCPLCRTERSLLYPSKLTKKNYLQIFTISLVLMVTTFPIMKERCLVWFFIVWVSFEAGLKVLFRQQVPCPHCGFDATWYKRDVKVARSQVKEFWDKQKGVQGAETGAGDGTPKENPKGDLQETTKASKTMT